MYREGLRKYTLEAVDAMATEVEVATVAEGKVLEPFRVGVGQLEGSRLSPMRFASTTRGMLEAVEEEEVIAVGGVQGGGASAFMDDAVSLVEDVRQASQEITKWLHWGFAERHTFVLEEKVRVTLGAREQVDSARASTVDVVWVGDEGADIGPVAVRSFEVEKSGVELLGFLLGEGEQLQRTSGARRVVDLEGAHGEERAAVNAGQNMWAWATFIRERLERNVDLLPDLTQREASGMEFIQIRALRAQYGCAADRRQRQHGPIICELVGFTQTSSHVLAAC